MLGPIVDKSACNFTTVNLLCANEPVKIWRYHQRFKSEQALPKFYYLANQPVVA